ncbi:type VII secretion protein EccE [Micromonospora sp. DT31]|uniref:type VII secretion protein EccE n=1 Tax=Micromonospora sp. DT31 TaxID=3393434 RepID=UPI003CEF305D
MGTTGLRIGLGQVICWQFSCCLALLSLRGPLALAVTGVTLAVVAVAVSVLPWRGRWLYQWLALGVRYLLRRREPSRPAGDGADLLDFLAPGAVLRDVEPQGRADDAMALVSQPAGVTAILEVQPDDHAFFATQRRPLPNLLTLLPSAETSPLPTCLQLVVVTDTPAALPGPAGAIAASYRLVSGGDVPAGRYCWLAIQVLRTPAAFRDETLRPVLLNVVNRTRRRLRDEHLSSTPLSATQVLSAASVVSQIDSRDLADGGAPRETWRGWHSGTRLRTAFRVTGWPGRPWWPHPAHAGCTVAVSALAVSDPARGGRDGEVMVESTIGLSAADQGTLLASGASLHRLMGSCGGTLEPFDARHRPGVAATAPLGWTPKRGRALPARRGTTRPVNVGTLTQVAGGAGLTVGRDRQGQPVVLRVARTSPTRIVAVGGIAFAQLLVYRWLALGVKITLQTTRPEPWSAFARRAGVDQSIISFAPLGEPAAPAAAGRPRVVVVDAGPVDWRHTNWQAPGQSTVVVRQEVTVADVALLSVSDIAVLQPLTPDEAAIAATALRCATAGPWMTRIGPSQITVISQGTARWATLNPTDTEANTVGSPIRPHP